MGKIDQDTHVRTGSKELTNKFRSTTFPNFSHSSEREIQIKLLCF